MSKDILLQALNNCHHERCWVVVFEPNTDGQQNIGNIYEEAGKFYGEINSEKIGPFPDEYSAAYAVRDKHLEIREIA